MAIIIRAIAERFLVWGHIRDFRSKVARLPQRLILTFIAILPAILLFLPRSQKAISEYANIDEFFLAVGGMIGTVIALIFSLSIIVVQRAAETFTPFISRLYRDDRKTHLIFITLVLLCVASFMFAVNGVVFGLSQAKLLPIEIVIIALTYDLSRLQYRRVSQLMDTNKALDILLQRMFSHIDHLEKNVNKIAAKLKTKSQGNQARKIPIEDYQTYVYHSSPRHTELLAIGLGEMTELAVRAVSKGEIHGAQKAISCINQLAIYYLNSRKANILIFPAPTVPLSGVSVGDVDKILDPIYEHLLEINRRAVENKSQTISIAVVECLGSIGNHLLTIGEKSQRIAWKPIGYLRFCVQDAQTARMHDVALRGSRALLAFVNAVPTSSLDIRVYIPVIELWRDITANALIANNPTVADLVLKDLMVFLDHILKRKLPIFSDTFSLSLDEIYRLVRLSLANEQQSGGPFSPYQMTNPQSIGYLIETAATLMVKQEDHDWINPYDDFIELNKKVHSHFRHIGENFDIGESQLVWEISQTIKYINDVFLRLVQEPITDDRERLDDLVNQVTWHISFYWAAFYKATKINHHFAYMACDQIGQTSMEFYELGFIEVLTSGVSAIRSIAVSYSKKGENKSVYQTADLLTIIWHLRVLSEAKEDPTTTDLIDGEIKKAEFWEADEGGPLASAFDERKYRLQRELLELNGSPLDDSTTLLKRFLRQNYPAALQKMVEEIYGPKVRRSSAPQASE